MIIRLLAAAIVLAPLLSGCAAVAVTGAVVGGAATVASTAVTATVKTTATAVDVIVPDGSEEATDGAD